MTRVCDQRNWGSMSWTISVISAGAFFGQSFLIGKADGARGATSSRVPLSPR
jgi:hypothetical protein